MSFLKRVLGSGESADNDFLEELKLRVCLPYDRYQTLSDLELSQTLLYSKGLYIQGLSAERAGNREVANRFYRRAIKTSPFNIEALDNLAINLVHESRFSDAVPLLEQSIAAEPDSQIAYRFLVKCYREAVSNVEALRAIKFFTKKWPEDSPFLDFSTIGQDIDPNAGFVEAPPFRPGQVWRYRTRKSDRNSTVWIRLVEDHGLDQPVIHISVTRVKMKRTSTEALISHIPIFHESLISSVIEPSNDQQTWDGKDNVFGEGFTMWHEAFHEGNAGVFSISLSEAVDEIDQPADPKN